LKSMSNGHGGTKKIYYSLRVIIGISIPLIRCPFIL
jgi:hypothetical protein